MVIHHGGQARFGHANQSQTGPELSFDQALVVEQNRQGRAGYGGDGIQEAEPRSEREADKPFRLDRPPDAACLDKDERKKNSIGDELDPARMKRGEKVAADCNAGQQADENGIDPVPYSRNAGPIDEKHIQVDEDFDQNQSGIQNAIGIENERDRHGERRKPVPKGSVHKGGKESNSHEHDRADVKGGHDQCFPFTPFEKSSRL